MLLAGDGEAVTIVVTGATGFIGNHLVRALIRRDRHVRAVVGSATKASLLPADVETVVVGDIGAPMDWKPILEGADGVVHLAGRAHVLHATSPETAYLYWRTNVEGTRQLGEAAARVGVKRFVYVSSSKAMGERTAPGEAWREDTLRRPGEPDRQRKVESGVSLGTSRVGTPLDN